MTTAIESLDYQAALALLYGRINYERVDHFPYRSDELKLDRMRRLLELIGNPQARFPIVHVAGTKGKGSVAQMIATVLTAAGYRTGLYTSPHLQTVEERFVVDGCRCLPDELARHVAVLLPAIERLDAEAALGGELQQGPTFFEITTALALLHFARQDVAAAVVEVGLGGRLDSTNVCQPEICVITSIDFDHMRQLGNTLAAIAGEKAGIIKPGVPIVSGVVDDEPKGVIEQVAAERGSRLFSLGDAFSYWCSANGVPSASGGSPAEGSVALNYRDHAGGTVHEIAALQLAMLGRHQAANAAVAVATLLRLRERHWRIPDEAIRVGLAAARLPARVEVLQTAPTVIVDAAHNVSSVQALLSAIDPSLKGCGRRTLIFATSRDKDVAGMLRLLLPKFSHVLLTRFEKNPRYLPLADLAAVAQTICDEHPQSAPQIEIVAEPREAWQRARAATGETDLICVTGSFFLAGELREIMLSSLAPPVAALVSP